MHKIQQKILGLAENKNLAGLTLRQIGESIVKKEVLKKLSIILIN